jgi:hypothetical protein
MNGFLRIAAVASLAFVALALATAERAEAQYVVQYAPVAVAPAPVVYAPAPVAVAPTMVYRRGLFGRRVVVYSPVVGVPVAPVVTYYRAPVVTYRPAIVYPAPRVYYRGPVIAY